MGAWLIVYLGHITFEMLARYPNSNVEQTIGYKNQNFMRDVSARNVNE